MNRTTETVPVFSPVFSMTGFASLQETYTNQSSKAGHITGSISEADEKWSFEIRSVNHRFLEVKVRLPKEFQSLDTEIRALIEKKIKRGSVEVTINRTTRISHEVAHLDSSACKKIWAELNEIKSLIDPSLDLSFSHLLKVPGVFSTAPREVTIENYRAFFQASLQMLLANFIQMRKIEGEALVTTIKNQMSEIEKTLTQIQKERTRSTEQHQKKILDRVTKAFQDFTIPTIDEKNPQLFQILQSRVAQEVQIALERADFQEELDRFLSHLTQVEDLLKSGGTIGRKLDFLIQELNREINTLSNKAQDATISQLAVDIKVILEQIREQTMNLE